jgi:hypothetical protein
MEGLGSPGVEFGVDLVRSLVVEHFGRYKFARGVLVAVHRRGLSAVKKQKYRGLCENAREIMNSG